MSSTSSNDTTLISSYEDLFHFCWNGQSCSSCHNLEYSVPSERSPSALPGSLSSGIPKHPCVFCPFSGVCVPNLHTPQLLSPIWHKDICPYHGERFELRSHGMGCGVSTATFLSIWFSIMGTLAALLLCWAFLIAFRSLRSRWKRQGQSVWWPNLRIRPAKGGWWSNRLPIIFRRQRAQAHEPASERAPLLVNSDND